MFSSSDSSCLAFLLAEDPPRFAGTLFMSSYVLLFRKSLFHVYIGKLVDSLIISRGLGFFFRYARFHG